MTLIEFIAELKQAVNTLKENGINPNNVNVVIHHSGRETTGNTNRIQTFVNITRDEIPYDVCGMDYNGSEVIKIHDNVVIIEGDY